MSRYLVCPRDIGVCKVNTYKEEKLETGIFTDAHVAITTNDIPPGYVCSYKIAVPEELFRANHDHH
jgi:hypothetical protein